MNTPNKSDKIRKAKNNYLYTIHGKKFYDLSASTNIIGHSHRLLTTLPKNALSAAWNMRGNSIYYNRFIGFFRKKFPLYEIFYTPDLNDFFLRLFNHGIVPTFHTADSSDALKHADINIPRATDSLHLYDASQLYLYGESPDKQNSYDQNSNVILNCYWYSDLEFDTMQSDIVILPQLYCGYTDICLVLIKKTQVQQYDFLENVINLPSFTLICCLHLYNVIKKIEAKTTCDFTINSDKIIQKGRMFAFKDNFKQYYEILKTHNILINDKMPYSYLPITLETYQIKYLNKIFSEI